MKRRVGFIFVIFSRLSVLVLMAAIVPVFSIAGEIPGDGGGVEEGKLRPLPNAFEAFGKKDDDSNLNEVFDKYRQNPSDPQRRTLLAEVYSEDGLYGSLSKFFRLTAAFIDGSEFVTAKDMDEQNVVSCSLYSDPFEQARKKARAARREADNIAEQVRNGELTKAQSVSAAEKAIENHGAHCALLAEWSLATLSACNDDRQSLGQRREELALRLLVTLAESGTFPSGMGGTAAVYYFLSEYFISQNDPISAYIATLTARERLLEGSSTGFWEKEDMARMISLQIETLEPIAREARCSQGF